MRQATLITALALAPWACVIDGVPLPDETDDASSEDNESPAGFESGVNLFATRSTGVTLVFGLPGAVQADATVIAVSGQRQARTIAVEDGSFNIAISGDLATTINVSVLVGGKQVATTTINTPVSSSILVPDGTTVAGDSPPEFAAADASRVDSANANLVFPADSFPPFVTVAIANLDSGSTATATAAGNGSLTTQVKAASGDTLYVVALANTGASSPYIITVP